jgi:phenylpropionate dioxygenase-like ring-hydroxylating dioxygenase large terminal subunit
MMQFLTNTWYAASWSDDVGESFLARTILEEPLLLFRRSDGSVATLRDTCPHRFAPLHLGKRVGDEVQCPYHGLRFDGFGHCTHNPHGTGAVPRTAVLRTFVTRERDGIVWVWMGDAERADEARIPDFSVFSRADGAFTPGQTIHQDVSYELVNDNLFDTSHATYLHKALGTGTVANVKIETREEKNTVYATRRTPACKPEHLFVAGGAAVASDRVDYTVSLRWNPPGWFFFEISIRKAGSNTEPLASMFSAQLLTPETATSMHYMWKAFRTFAIGDRAFTDMMVKHTNHAFTTEDYPMVRATQERMRGREFWSLKPMLIESDRAAVLGRRLLGKLVSEQEHQAATASGNHQRLRGEALR